jgi:AcrR family transcriptional regulator
VARETAIGPPDVPRPPWRTPRKTASARLPITQDLIVETALRILEAESLEGVSMRRVAQELGTGPASLYAHVANKNELLDLMFDRVAGEIELPEAAEGARWREQIRDLATSMHTTLVGHSDIARVALAHIPMGPNALVCSEAMLSILLSGGVPPQAAAWAVDALALYVTASAYEFSLWDLARRESGQSIEEFVRATIGPIGEYVASLPPEHFPNLVANVRELTNGDGVERFHFGLDLMLDGLAARVAP